MMKIDGRRPNNSCTEVLWRELSHLCVTVKELGYYLKKIQNYDALVALDWPHGMYNVLSKLVKVTGTKYFNYIQILNEQTTFF